MSLQGLEWYGTKYYIVDLCVPITSVPTCAAVHSAARGDLVVPRTSLRLNNRAFCVARPAARHSHCINTLLSEIA